MLLGICPSTWGFFKQCEAERGGGGGGAGANRVYCGDSNIENSWKIVVAYGCALDKNRASRAMQSLKSSVYLFKFTKRVELKFGSVSKGSF